jgi:AraC-like DNA-binding protein
MILIPELLQIWHYQAPRTRNHLPRIIPENRQDIEIFVSGKGFFEQEGRLVEVTAGTVLWHKSGDSTLYMTDLEDPYACIVVGFQADKYGIPVPRISQWKDRDLFQSFIDQILTEFHRVNPDMRKLACYIYGQLYWQCQALLETEHTNKRINLIIKRVTEWIEEYFMEDIDLQQLSDIAGISVPHLHTLFKKVTTKSPYQFIRSRRLQEAKILLASTSLPIQEIAIKSGFRDMGTFCKGFKQSTGLTAQDYRIQHLDTRR